jgi:hypothetical protein
MTPGSTLNIDLQVRGLAKRSKLLVPEAPGLPFSELSVGEHISGISWQQGAFRVWKVEARLLIDQLQMIVQPVSEILPFVLFSTGRGTQHPNSRLSFTALNTFKSFVGCVPVIYCVAEKCRWREHRRLNLM